MRRGPLAVVSLLVFLIFSQAAASRAAPGGAYSDLVGVYARIDKVVLEPNENAPDRIQIWGAFAVARTNYGDQYEPPVRGYMYFSCPEGKGEICRKEWADLRAIAGTAASPASRIIGFGNRRMPPPRMHKAEQKPVDPDPYPINVGLVKMTDENYPPVRELRLLPREPK